MMQSAWICAGTLALAAVRVAAAEPLGPEQLSERFASVFKVRAADSSGRVSSGSAVLIAPGRLVTTCHVTRAARSIQVSQAEMAWPAQAYFSDIPHDLCILSANGLAEREPVQFGTPDDLKVGDQVIAVGYRAGGRFAIAGGQLKALHPYQGASVLQVSAPFDHGQSGGALFDADGRLVGITAFKAVAGGDFHFALPLQWLPARALRGDAPADSSQDAHAKAFWERARAEQPWFLRAASLEAATAWDALYSVALEWVRAEDANPQSWLTLTRARARLRRADATDATHRRVVLSADSAGP